jgi:hypothetical protein
MQHGVKAAGLAILLAVISQAAFAQREVKPPETFFANAEVLGTDAGSSAYVTIHIEKYTDERNRNAMTEALRTGGYPAFLPALRAAPDIGWVEMNGRKVIARWARQQATEKGRTISVVTEAPLAFVGGGSVDAKPRDGYELAVIQMNVDSIGLGSGTMAAAARVRPGGPTGVQIDDYADKPVRLATVRKSYK